MTTLFKHIIKSTLWKLRIDLTANLRYDRQTRQVIRRVVKPGDCCIDIGCHKGEILDLLLQQSPLGQHWAFEPIPAMYEELLQKYGPGCRVLPYALGQVEEETDFQWVKNAPAFSGLQPRHYHISQPDIEVIKVKVKRLDDLIPPDTDIRFIKIDVEGGELPVLKGAMALLKRCRPAIIFECGLGASENYGTSPEAVFDLFASLPGYGIFLPGQWLKGKKPLSRPEFCGFYYKKEEYYFMSHQIR